MARTITLLTQFFFPETAATSQLLTELSVSLQRRGLELVVYTGQPAYHSASRRPGRELLEGVKIKRLFGTRLRRHVLAGRLLNAVTFSLSILFHLVVGKNPGVVVATSNPPFLPWVAWLASVTRGWKYAVLVHDLYPDIAIELGYMKQDGILARIWRTLNRLAFSRAHAVIMLGESMKEEVGKYFANEEEAKLHLIHSWADGAFIVPRPKEANPFARDHGLVDKIVVLYSGNIGMAHDFETLIETADRLRMIPELVFLFIGEGGKRQQLELLVRERGLTNVRFLPPVPYDELPYSLAAGDIGVVTLERGTEGFCEPSKLYGYLAAGLAILGLVGRRSEVSAIIRRHACGHRVDQEDVEGTVQVLSRWLGDRGELQQMKANARRCLEQYYDREQITDKYFQVLKNV